MDINNMKNMIVLKNLPSNMIEEAFVILKDNVKVHKEELAENNKTKKVKDDKNENRDYVIKEAEMIIEEYASKLEKKGNKSIRERKNLEAKCKKLKYSTILFGMFSFLSIITLLIR